MSWKLHPGKWHICSYILALAGYWRYLCRLSTVFTLVEILFSQTICHGMKDIKGSTDMTSKLSRCQHNLYAQKSHRYQVNKAFKFIIIWQKICITTNFFSKFLVVSRERKQMEVVKANKIQIWCMLLLDLCMYCRCQLQDTFLHSCDGVLKAVVYW